MRKFWTKNSEKKLNWGENKDINIFIVKSESYEVVK